MQGDETPTDHACAMAKAHRPAPRERPPEPVAQEPWTPPLRYDVESMQHWLDLSA